MNRTGIAVWLCVGTFMTAACSSSSPGTPAATGANATAQATAGRTDPPGPATPSTTASAPVPHVSLSQLRTADGSVVTVAAFGGPVQYTLHDGSSDPRPPRGVSVQAGSIVTGAERQRLLAAFNGGFLMRSRAGGRPRRPPDGTAGAVRSATSSTSPAARLARTPPAISSTRPACRPRLRI